MQSFIGMVQGVELLWDQGVCTSFNLAERWSPPLSLHPLPSLIVTVPICLLQLKEGHGKLESIPYKQEMGSTERLLCPGALEGPTWFQ